MKGRLLKKIIALLLAVLVTATIVPELTMAEAAESQTTATSAEGEDSELAVNSSAASMDIYGIYLGSESDDSGDAVLVESEGEFLLMDMGGVSSYENVKKFLQDRGVTTLSLYYSHLHSDHTGGLSGGNGFEQLLQDFNVEKVYVPSRDLIKDPEGLEDEDFQTKYDQIPKLYERNGYDTDNIIYLTVGDTFSFGDVSAEVIGPVGVKNMKKADMESDDDYWNNLSLVTMLTCGTVKYLTSGDSELYEAERLIKKYGSDLKADIYKMAHHGNGAASSAELLACIQPSYSFGLNSGKKDFLTTGKLKYRKTYRARADAAEYGIVYLTGDEHQSVKYSVNDGKIEMYTSKDSFTSPLRGLIKLYGGSMIPKNYEEQGSMDPYLYNYYYIKDNGKVFTGIKKIKGKYYLFGSGGCMEVGHYYQEGSKIIYRVFEKYTVGKSYYMRSFDEKTGAMLTGWFKTGGEKYYLDKKTGYRVSGFQKIGSKYYLFAPKGTLMTNVNKKTSKGTRRFGKTGAMVTGWLTLKGKTYYFDLKTGYRYTGFKKIGKKYYMFSSGGCLIKNHTVAFSGGTRYFGKTGAMVTGWATVNGRRCYFNPKTGYMKV